MSSYEMKCLHMTALLLVTEYSQIFKFLVANRSVPARFKDSKQISEKVNFLPAMIAITICTNQFHLRENGCESLKLAWYQIRLFQQNTNFRPEKQDYFFRYSLAPGNDPKSRFQFTFRPDFRKRFGIYVNQSLSISDSFHHSSIRNEQLINTVTRLVKISVILCRMQI